MKKDMDGEAFLALPSIDRLRHYVDELLSYREADVEDGVRTRIRLVQGVLGRLRHEHVKTPLTAVDLDRINQEIARAGLDERFQTGRPYRNVCWHCRRPDGGRTAVDAFVHMVCAKCDWVICEKCGACIDPRFGICERQEQARKGGANLKA